MLESLSRIPKLCELGMCLYPSDFVTMRVERIIRKVNNILFRTASTEAKFVDFYILSGECTRFIVTDVKKHVVDCIL